MELLHRRGRTQRLPRNVHFRFPPWRFDRTDIVLRGEDLPGYCFRCDAGDRNDSEVVTVPRGGLNRSVRRKTEPQVRRSGSGATLAISIDPNRNPVFCILLPEQNSGKENEARPRVRDSHRILPLWFQRNLRSALVFRRVAHAIDFHFMFEEWDRSLPRFSLFPF